MYTFVKLGGSVITDKAGREAADLPLIARLAAEVAAARAARPALRLILGHGSGSFGHHYAARYGVPALSLQPSASLWAAGGQIVAWDTAHVAHALDAGLVPVVHGDVAFDRVQGTAIVSTEALLAYLALATELRPDRVVLVGEDAVYSADPRTTPDATRVPLITAANLEAVLSGAGGSHAVDVTGGMRSKLELMWRLAQANPGLEVRLIGPAPGNLAAVLRGDTLDVGTTIRLS
jgi:isopentenyl phosphate kinase